MSETDRIKPLKKQVLDEPRDVALDTRGVLMIKGTRSGDGTPGLEDVWPAAEREEEARREYDSLPQPPFSLWASQADVPTTVCFDARLHGELQSLKYPEGTTDGQAGWDMGLSFVKFRDFATKLRRPLDVPGHICGKTGGKCQIRTGQITRLAINMHGLADGAAFVNGKEEEPLTADNIHKFFSELEAIGQSTSSDSIILLMGCVAGLGENGSRLLSALSNLWFGRKVVGFATLGFAHGGGMARSGAGCSEPGMRATKEVASGHPLDRDKVQDLLAIWDDSNALPWASEDFRSAKVALNG